jgi:(p)ppGpp synthase/HD superfamily hydrolase
LREFFRMKKFMYNLNAKSIEHNVALYDVVLEVKSKKELNEIISKIRNLKNVLKITRL